MAWDLCPSLEGGVPTLVGAEGVKRDGSPSNLVVHPHPDVQVVPARAGTSLSVRGAPSRAQLVRLIVTASPSGRTSSFLDGHIKQNLATRLPMPAGPTGPLSGVVRLPHLSL
jgi:hypothetical protein